MNMPAPIAPSSILLDAAVSALTAGEDARALDLFEEILAHLPDDIPSLRGRATTLLRLGRMEDSAAAFAGALRRAPNDTFCQLNLGLSLQRMGHAQRAAQVFGELLVHQPDHIEALLGLACVCCELNQPQLALRCTDRILHLQPQHGAALLQAGVAFGQAGLHADALAQFARVPQWDPLWPVALIEQGVALGHLRREADALTAFEQACDLQADNATAHAGRAFALARLNRLEDARLAVELALQINPSHGEALSHRGFILLSLGRLREGFAAQEHRWNHPALRGVLPLERLNTRWTGNEDVRGKRLLLLHEQGLGDTLQFVRFAREAAARGAIVIVQVPESLCRLLQGVEGIAEVHALAGEIAAHELWCPMMSLPLALGTTRASIPAPIPYVWPLTEDHARWHKLLPPSPYPRVGLVWAGRQQGEINAIRDMPFAELAPLLGSADHPQQEPLPEIEFISLQQQIPQADLATVAACPRLQRLGEQSRDFADTAALIAQLDLVIGVDTAVVHLAGALGKPVWLLNRHAPCWRWFGGEGDSPWYPSLRQFRQPAPWDWTGLMRQVRAALAQRFSLRCTASA